MTGAGKGVPKSGRDGDNKTVSQLIGVVTASGIAWSLYKSFQGRPADKATKVEGTSVPCESRPKLEKEYEILKGDTLWGISTRYGVTVGDVKEANAIEDVNFILAGDILVIPQ